MRSESKHHQCIFGNKTFILEEIISDFKYLPQNALSGNAK